MDGNQFNFRTATCSIYTVARKGWPGVMIKAFLS